MGLFDRWFGSGVTDPTVAARQRSAAWGAFLAAQRAALPPRPVADGLPMATAPAVGAAGVPSLATPAMPPSTSPASALSRQTTTVLVIEDGEEGV